MKKIIAAAAVAAGMAVFATGAQAGGIQQGKWAMTMTTKMQGAGFDAKSAAAMKAMQNMPPEKKAMMQAMMGKMNMGVSMNGQGMTTTTTACVTDQNPVPETPHHENCKTTHSTDGNTVHFEVTCPKSTSKGDVTYDDHVMKGAIVSQTAQGKITTDIAGKYIGPCD